MLRTFLTKSSLSIYIWVALLSSMLLSLIINQRADLINPDGICYLRSAEAIANQGLHAGMTLCGQAKWPFYSILIATFAKIGHLPFPLVAYCLDALFTGLTIVFYLLIIHHLGASQRVLGWGLLIILFSPTLNSVREYIIRDHGYWALYFISLYLFLRYVDKPQLFIALLINLSLIGAALFRVEGFLFLLGVPSAIWFMSFSWREKLRYTLHLNMLTLAAITVLSLWALTQPQESLSNLGRLNDVFHHLQNGFNLIVTRYQDTKAALVNHILNMDSAKHADLVLVLLLITWYCLSIISNLSWTYFLLLLSGLLVNSRLFPAKYLAVLGVYLFLNLCVTFSFLLEKMFLSKRYLVGLSLILLLFVPFAWDSLWQKTGKIRGLVAAIFIIIGLIYTSHYFNLNHGKQYVREAASWIKTNIPTEAKLYINDYQLMYYSDHYGDKLFINLREFSSHRTIETMGLKHYDYLAFRIYKPKPKPLFLSAIPKEKLQQFSNEKGEQVIIYKVKK